MDTQNQRTPPEQPQIVTAVPQENNVNKILISVVGVLAVITTIIGSYYFLTRKQAKQQASVVSSK